MSLNKQQLQVLNTTNFPNNTTGYITPALLRDFNSQSVDAMALQTEVTALSTSFQSQLNSLEDFSSSLVTNFATVTQLNASSSTIEAQIATLAGTASVTALSSSTYNQFQSQANTNAGFTNTINANKATFNSYTQSNNTAVADKASLSQDNYFVGNQYVTGKIQVTGTVTGSNITSFALPTASFNSYTASNDSKVNSLIAATASYATSAITASSLVTASFSSQLLTFTKGDGSQFSVTIPDISGSTFDTGSLITTGSSSNPTQSITGSLIVSSSNTLDLLVRGRINISGPAGGTGAPQLIISASDGSALNTITRQAMTITAATPSISLTGTNGSAIIGATSIGISGNAGIDATSTIVGVNSTASFAIASVDAGATYDNELWIRTSDIGTEFTDWDTNTTALSTIPIMKVGPNNGGIQPIPQFERGIGVSGSASFTELTGSLSSFSASVDSRLDSEEFKSTTFATTGSNTFTGNNQFNGGLTSSTDILVNNATIGNGAGNVDSNVVFGNNALVANTSALGQVAIGQSTLASYQATGNGYNVAVGYLALQQLGLGGGFAQAAVNNNVVVGGNSGYTLVAGTRNTIVGSSAFSTANNTERNTGMGRGVLAVLGASTTNGSGSKYNTAIGHNALFSLGSGSNNTFIHGGNASGEGITSGSNNIVVGQDVSLPSVMESNTIIGRGIAGLSSPLSNNVILADGKGNITLQKNGATASVLIPTAVELTGTTSNGFVYQQQSSGSVAGAFNTVYGKDSIQLFQYQGQPYAFNLNLQSGQFNGISGSQFQFALQTNGGGSTTFGGATYFSLISGSLSQSVVGGTEIKGADRLVNSAGGLEIAYTYANAGFMGKTYIDKGLYVSASGGVSEALTTNGNAVISGSLKVSGSSTFTNTASFNAPVVINNNSDLYVYGHKQFNVGAFTSTINQSGSAAVSQSMKFNTTDISNGVTLNGSTTQMLVTNAGTYNIQFSAQLVAVAGADDVWIWLKKNGTNVTNSAGRVTLANNEELIAAWNYAVEANANDYFELVWQTSGGDAVLLSNTATGNIPAIPSVIATVTQVR